MLAALAVGTTLLSSFTWVFNFLIHASTQSIAAAQASEVGGRVRIGLMVALAVGLLSTALLYFFRFPLYQLISSGNISPELIDQYFLPRIIGHPFAIIFMTGLSMLRGLSRVNTALYLVIITTGLNILLSWYFLYPLGIGLAGAAYGTVLANVIGLIFVLAILWREPKVRSSLHVLPPKEDWFQFGKNSLDLFGRSLAITGSLFFASRLAASVNETNLAAHQILLQVWLFASFFIDGVAITANVKGAELVKSGNQQGFRLMQKNVAILGLILGTIFCLTYFIFSTQIQKIFSHDRDVLVLLDLIWPWVALTQITNALAFVYDGVLFGLGAIGGFKWVRRWMLAAALLVFLPISLSGNGLDGVWYGLMAMNLFRLITCYWTYSRLVKIIR